MWYLVCLCIGACIGWFGCSLTYKNKVDIEVRLLNEWRKSQEKSKNG